MEYYAKSRQKILTQGEIDKVKNELEDLIMNLEGEFTETDLKIIRNNISHLQDTEEEGQKTLKEHQNDIVKCAELFFEEYGEYFTEKEKCLVIEACRMHDWGKANLIFQGLVNSAQVKEQYSDIGRITQIPHGFLSAVTISRNEFKKLSELFSEADFRPFITAVYHHHDREDIYEGDEIQEYAAKYYAEQISEYLKKDIKKLYCSNQNKLLYRNNSYACETPIEPKMWEEYLLIKGLLNKFDYTVSAGYERAEIAPDLREKKLKKNIEVYLQNKELRPAQKFMMEHRNENLVVVAPTGSGKTEAALLWLNGEKGFYTLPLKVSSNAIYSRIKNNYSYENVALLHSDSMAMYLKEYKENDLDINEKYDRARMLAQPLTVCTVDQLFKFVYKALGTEIFAATLKYSKLILDEIQSYEPAVIAIIIYGLKTIQEMGGRFAIITATFPPVLKHFMEENGLIENKQYIFKDFTGEEYLTNQVVRHKIRIRKSEMDIDEILEQGRNKKILVICNTVSRAQKIYKEMQEKSENVYLLHSRYIRRDRAFLEKQIMDFAESEEAGIWITTQIVEASLDIDFDVLFTEMATADSLLQRMGRCNRAGYKSTDQPNVYVYVNNSGVRNDKKRGIYDRVIYDRSVETLRRYDGKLMSETDKRNYINEVYDINAIEGSWYFDTIKKNLDKFENLKPLDYKSKKDVDYDFREINSITLIPDDEYYNNCDIIEKEIELLQTPRVDREIRQLIRSDILDRTLSLNLYSSKYGVEGIDTCIEGTNIHRTSMRYEFDEETGTGVGLDLFNKNDEDNFL